MTARFISSVLRGRSSALLALAIAATVSTTAQAAIIFTSNLSSVTPPSGASTGDNFQVGYNGGAVTGITSTPFQTSPFIPGYNFVFANSTNAALNAAESNTIGAAGDAGTVKLDSATTADPFDTQDSGAFLALDSVYQKSAIDINIATVMGQTYTVTFDWAGTQQTLGMGATTDMLTVDLGGAPSQSTASTASIPQQGFSGWFQVTDTFTATTTGTSILSFLASGTPTMNQQPAFTLLDNISVATVTTPPPSTVPEPSSLMLLSTGLIGVGGFIRSRFKKS